jgi:hypothetical protein
MVYERLPRQIKHRRISEKTCSNYIILIDKSVSTSILATCKQVYDEASGILHEAIQNFIMYLPPKVIWSFPSDAGHKRFFGTLQKVIVQCCQAYASPRIPPFAEAMDTVLTYGHLYDTDTEGSTASKDILRWAKKASVHQVSLMSRVAKRTLHVVGQHCPDASPEQHNRGIADFVHWLESAHRLFDFSSYGLLAFAGYHEGSNAGGGYRAVTPEPANIPLQHFVRSVIEAFPKMDKEVWADQWLD